MIFFHSKSSLNYFPVDESFNSVAIDNRWLLENSQTTVFKNDHPLLVFQYLVLLTNKPNVTLSQPEGLTVSLSSSFWYDWCSLTGPLQSNNSKSDHTIQRLGRVQTLTGKAPKPVIGTSRLRSYSGCP